MGARMPPGCGSLAHPCRSGAKSARPDYGPPGGRPPLYGFPPRAPLSLTPPIDADAARESSRSATSQRGGTPPGEGLRLRMD